LGVKTADKRRLNELRAEVGAKDSFKMKLWRSKLNRAGHVEGMGDEKLAEIRCLGCGGKRTRERPTMRLEDCVKRDLGRVDGEWRTTATNRSWRLLIQNAVGEK